MVKFLQGKAPLNPVFHYSVLNRDLPSHHFIPLDRYFPLNRMPLNGAFTLIGSWDNQGSIGITVTFGQEKTFDNIVARTSSRLTLSLSCKRTLPPVRPQRFSWPRLLAPLFLTDDITLLMMAYFFTDMAGTITDQSLTFS